MVKKKSVKSQYSLEFKNQVLDVLDNSPKNIAQIAREFGVSYPTLIIMLLEVKCHLIF